MASQIDADLLRFRSIAQFDESAVMKLGEGGFGQVMKRSGDGKVYVVISVNLMHLHRETERMKRSIFNEADVIRGFMHPIYASLAVAMTSIIVATPIISLSVFNIQQYLTLIALIRLMIHEKDDTGMTLLSFCSLHGGYKIANFLIAIGADIDGQDFAGCTPLMFAATGGHVAIVELLISNGCVINAIDYSGQTALHYAAQFGHRDICRLLLYFGADPKAEDMNKISCEALMNQFMNQEALLWVLDSLDET